MSLQTFDEEYDYRQPQAGRIRTGAKVAARGDRQRPIALDKFRFTSGNRDFVAICAAKYGGEVKPFDQAGSGDKWMVDTDATEIDVIVPIPKPYTLTAEIWDPHLTRRCNGDQCEILVTTPDGADWERRPCMCRAAGKQTCPMKLRLSVGLTGVPTVGSWRYDTSSDNGIKEIRGFCKFLAQHAGPGLYPCKLRLEHRTAPTERGKPTKKYTIVVPDLATSIEALVTGDTRLVQLPSPIHAGELGAGSPTVTPPSPTAGEPIGGNGGAGDASQHRPPVGPSLASSPSSSAYEVDDKAFPIDDDIVDAEIVHDDITGAHPINADLLADWRERLTTHQKNKAVIRGRALALEMGEPVPTTFETISDAVADRLMRENGLAKAGTDDPHARHDS